MKLSQFVCSAAIAFSFVVPVKPAFADLHGILIPLIGQQIIQGSRSSRPRSSGISSAQREQNRQVQTALNYFNYPVGRVDGSIGPRTRSAIRNFEADMGFGIDGQLTDFERNFLTGSYFRAQSAAQVPAYAQVLARQGANGLLRTFRNEQRGVPTPGVQPALTPATPAVPTPPQPAPAGLPSFQTAPTEAKSLANHCTQINVLTTTNGGFSTLATMTDPELVLNEQFCLARNIAVSDSAQLMARIPNMTDAQMVQQCQSLGAFMMGKVATMASTEPAQVINTAATALQSSGQSAQQLQMSGRICLGLGYREDDDAVALGSALIMAGINQQAYGEIISHHLREGFGVEADRARAKSWMTAALAALESGAVAPAFLPNQAADRLALLKAASSQAPTTPPVTGLPTFTLPSGN